MRDQFGNTHTILMSRCSRFRTFARCIPISLLILLLFTVGCTNTPSVTSTSSQFEEKVSNITSAPRYEHTSWGIIVVDPSSGTALYEHNANELFLPGSTAKLFSSAAILEALGPEYRFVTPVYAVGDVGSSGELDGILVLVASGDLTMGGRTLPDDTIEYTNIDHGDANALEGAILTATHPCAGLDKLASQVKGSGIRKVSDVVIDDRLFETANQWDPVLSPIVINDNLVDIMIVPGIPGTPPALAMRPETSGYILNNRVTTGPAGSPLSIAITEEPGGMIVVSGIVAADAGQVNQTYSVRDPAAYARTLFIEALERQGIEVTARANDGNPGEKLPEKGRYAGSRKVAELTSPPLIEDVTLTLKVSQNLHANSYIMLLATASNGTGFSEGMKEEGRILSSLGLDTMAVSLGDGAGGVSEDRISPGAAAQLLTIMHTRPYADKFVRAQPILGIDGSLATSCRDGNPACGRVYAKTGTSINYDPLNNRAILFAKSLAGYIDAKSGKRLVFAVYANNVPISSLDDMTDVGEDLGNIAGLIYEYY